MDREQRGDSSVLSAQEDSTNSPSFSQLKSLAAGLESLRKDGALCDVTVTVKGTQFPAHKVVLAALSSVFRAMFTGRLKEASQSEVLLQDEVDLSAEGFEILLDFAYTGCLNLTIDNVFEVLASACHLHVTLAIEGSIDFISTCFVENKLSFDDYLKITSMAGNYDLDRLKEVADQHIARNFGEVSLTPDFLEHMTANDLGLYLMRDDLAVESEKQVLKAVVKWLHHAPSRIHDAASLLKKVHLGLFSSHDLVDLIDASILAIPEVKTLFDQLMLHIALNSPVNGQLANSHPELFTPRVSTKSLLAIGGVTSNMGRPRFFCNQRQEWITLMKFARLPFDGVCHHSLITVSGKLFLIGGVWLKNGEACTQNFFYTYDLTSNKWTRLPSMRVERSLIAVVHLNRYIYAIGGRNEKGEWLETVERYSLLKGIWQTVAPMEASDSGSFPSAVAHDDRIIVSSANTEDGVQYLSCFDPSKNSWTSCNGLETSSPGRILRLADTCLLVTYRTVTSKLGKKEKWRHCPVVHEVTTYDHGVLRFNDHDQSLVPESNLYPFRVGRRMYLMANEACLDSQIDVDDGQVYDVVLDSWDKLNKDMEGAGIIEFPFNAQKFRGSVHD